MQDPTGREPQERPEGGKIKKLSGIASAQEIAAAGCTSVDELSLASHPLGLQQSLCAAVGLSFWADERRND